jgi:hypothetical protein
VNRSLSQAEYIDILSWQPEPDNDGLDIAKYRIYRMEGNTPTLVVEMEGDQSEYRQRRAGREVHQYAVAAVTRNGWEGAPALVTVQ